MPCSTQINTVARDYLNNKTRNSNVLLCASLKIDCKNFNCNRDTSISLLSGLLNLPSGKGNSNCFSFGIDQDKQEGLLLSKRLFSCSGGNIHYNDEVVGIPNPGQLHIVLRHEMDKTLSQQTD